MIGRPESYAIDTDRDAFSIALRLGSPIARLRAGWSATPVYRIPYDRNGMRVNPESTATMIS